MEKLKNRNVLSIDLDHDSPLLSDQYLQKNDYLDLKTNERDFHRIAFEGATV